ncbi:SLATT domain-containing protein [Saccharopolyspora flava]|uniref:SLATT domain-containing protein n=1 Tax=Saccharopolyspora flava TaxID=95161 RepID=UPI001FEC761B|nr:SLATT domain-containing protein [Saccharopolyspora flava]
MTESVDITDSGNKQKLVFDHKIRKIEHDLRIARRRRRWSNLSLVFGPVLAVLLYCLYWVPGVSGTVLQAVYLPTIPVAVACCVASYRLKRYPGGPLQKGNRQNGEVYFFRQSEDDLELILSQERDARRLLIASSAITPKIRRVAYKEEAYHDIDQLRSESKGYRRTNNILQGVIIIGSLGATATSGVAVDAVTLRWVTVGITFAVGISSGFMGYFKYKERSFYLQQTADAIEQEWEAVEIGVGRYKRCESEDEALAEFVEEVHRLKAEQKKRQQNLEQPPEARDAGD